MLDQSKFGFIQGRLSPAGPGIIQEFPKTHWREEFGLARENNWGLIEWTIDHDGIEKNPIYTKNGQEDILSLMEQYGIKIPSITADFIMHAPFYKTVCDDDFLRLLGHVEAVIKGASLIGSKMLVVPLVDNGKPESPEQDAMLRKGMRSLSSTLQKTGVKIAFELDLAPDAALNFIGDYDDSVFGINYDIGNSACSGFDPAEEINTYGSKIINLHIKDRLLGGTTVPLGEGDADFKSVFCALKKANYKENYIFQTARSQSGDHVGALNAYRDFINASF